MTGARPTSTAAATWQSRLEFAVLTHDVIVAGDRMLGGVSPGHAAARQHVVDVIDAALASGVPEATIEAELATIRAAAADHGREGDL